MELDSGLLMRVPRSPVSITFGLVLVIALIFDLCPQKCTKIVNLVTYHANKLFRDTCTDRRIRKHNAAIGNKRWEA